MDLGVALPTSGRLASPANIVRIAQEAERLGYAAVWTYERLLRPLAELPAPDGSMQRIPEQYRLTYEPLETLSYVAAVTDRVRLGTSVVDALLHPPVVLARRFATLDQLSGSRSCSGRPPRPEPGGPGGSPTASTRSPSRPKWSRPWPPSSGRRPRRPGATRPA